MGELRERPGGGKEVFKRVRERDDLILHLAQLHPKALRHSGVLLAEADLA